MQEPDYYIKRTYAYAPQVDGVIPDPEPGKYDANNPIKMVETFEESNLVTSLISGLALETRHAPCIDIDVPCELIPSSQLGHYHLYIHHPMSWFRYKAILNALSAAGVVEEGFFKAAVSRGFSALRHIGKHKPGVKHPGSDILKENAKLRHENFMLRQELMGLKQEAVVNSITTDPELTFTINAAVEQIELNVLVEELPQAIDYF